MTLPDHSTAAYHKAIGTPGIILADYRNALYQVVAISTLTTITKQSSAYYKDLKEGDTIPDKLIVKQITRDNGSPVKKPKNKYMWTGRLAFPRPETLQALISNSKNLIQQYANSLTNNDQIINSL